ncbi:MAG TPA: hypothetical protein VKY74_25975 [Chloroflexia bacterium]|nr:hypothetical protein [Chloroflexia bacterium]
MHCPYCRTPNQVYAGFCVECGESLAGGASGPEPAAGAGTAGCIRSGPGRSAEGRAGARPRGPAILAAGLVLILVAVAVGDILWEQAHAATYHAGRAAEAAQHWDQAAAAYGAAGDYRDAAARLRGAQAQLVARDRFYALGQAAARQQDWAAARRAFAQAAAVEPDFGDLPARLAEAGREAGRMAMAGLIYRRRNPPAAGLYLQGPLDHPATALPGSDGESQVLAFAPDGQAVVYDGPRPGAGRRLYLSVLAPAAGQVREMRLLPAGLALNGWGLFCPGGFWWFSDATTDVAYYDLLHARLTLVPVPAPRQLLRADPVQGRLLFADPYMQAGHPRSRLVLTGVDGAGARLVADSPGLVRSAELSPDGKWLAYSREEVGAMRIYGYPDVDWAGFAWQAGRDDARTTSLILRGLGPDGGPFATAPGLRLDGERMLDHLVLPDDAPAGGAITARFVPGRAATLVADRSDRNGRVATVYELATGLETAFWLDAAPAANLAGPFFSPRGGYLLVEEGGVGGLRLLAQDLAALPASRGQVVPIQAPAGSQVLGQVALHDDYVLYLIERAAPQHGRADYALYSVPLTPGAAPPPPVRLFAAIYSPGFLNEPSITLAPNGTVVAYVQPDGTLVGVPLDGAPPLPLAADVLQVWSPRP